MHIPVWSTLVLEAGLTKPITIVLFLCQFFQMIKNIR